MSQQAASAATLMAQAECLERQLTRKCKLAGNPRKPTPEMLALEAGAEALRREADWQLKTAPRYTKQTPPEEPKNDTQESLFSRR